MPYLFTTWTAWAIILLATITSLPTAQAQSSLDKLTWSSPVTISGASAVTTTIVADFDGDGVDEFAGFEGGKHSGGYKLFAWFDHAGGQSFTKHNFNNGWLSSSWEFFGSAAPADLDRDGDVDIVFTMDHHSGTTQEGKVLWAENPRRGGSATGTWPVHEIKHFTSGTEHINDMAVADFDGDGKLDVAVRHLGQNRVRLLFQNSPADWEVKTISVSPREGLAVSRIDGDSRPDLALNGSGSAPPQIPARGAGPATPSTARSTTSPTRASITPRRTPTLTWTGTGTLTSS